MNANTADPVTIARNLLDSLADADETEAIEAPASVLLTLATTALDLTAKAARVKALADRLDAEAADDFDGVSGTSVSLVKYETAKAIRAALNGENR